MEDYKGKIIALIDKVENVNLLRYLYHLIDLAIKRYGK